MLSELEQKVVAWYAESDVSNGAVLHDAELIHIDYTPEQARLSLEFIVGYPRMEDSAAQRVKVIFSGTQAFLCTSDLRAREQNLTNNVAEFIEQCREGPVDCWDSYSGELEGLYLFDLTGHPTWIEGGAAQIRVAFESTSWATEHGPITYDDLMALGRRQWDLWSQKVGPELSRE